MASGTLLRCLPFLALHALLGCASAPEVVPLEQIESGWDIRREALLGIDRWTLSGRVAIQLEDEAWSANMDWRQTSDLYLLDFYGPLGQGRLQLKGDAASVTARSGDGKETSARSAEALIYQELGWTLPVSGLRYWVRGVPAPQLPAAVVSLDEVGRLAHLEQAGWSIDYSAYEDDDGVDMPRRMRLNNGTLFVRLVVDSWTLAADSGAATAASGG